MAQADRPFPFGSAAHSSGQFGRPGFSIDPHQFRGRHHIATIVVLVTLAALAFHAFPSQRVTVFSDGGAVNVGATFDATREGLTGAEVALLPGDQLLEAGERGFSTVAVQRAVPVVVNADGVTIEVLGSNDTIAGVLATAGIRIGPGDVVLLNGVVTSPRAPVGAHADESSFEIQVRRALPITIVVDGISQDVMSTAPTVGEFVAELGLQVREVDLVTPPAETPVTAGMTVRLAPARSIAVTIDQAEGSLYTRAGTVAEVLAVLGIELSDKDGISHNLDESVTNGMSLVVNLRRIFSEEIEVPLAPKVVFATDDSMAPGAVQYVEGTNGTMVETWAVTYDNGVEISREKVGEPRVTVAPISGTVIVGPPSDGSAGTLRTSQFDGYYASSMTVLATWYNASHGGKERGDKWWGITSSGIPLKKGICAVDGTVIPMGTRFFVPGYGMCLAADVGGAIKGNHIDLGFPEDAGPIPWRTATLEIYILE